MKEWVEGKCADMLVDMSTGMLGAQKFSSRGKTQRLYCNMAK